MSLKKAVFFISLLFLYQNINASIIITNGLTHTHKVKDGTTYKGIITIENTSETFQNVKLYQKDYRYKSDGTSYYDDEGTNKRSNLKWIHLNTNQIKIEGKSKLNVAYEITVPAQTDPGSFWSVVMAEPVDDIKPNEEKSGIQLKSVIRYAIQIITTNDKQAEALLTFHDITLTKQNERRLLEIAIENNGQLFHTIETSIEIFESTSGSAKGVYRSSLLSLLPNNSKRFTIDISGVPPGKYNAAILASSNEEHVFGINIELEITDD